MDSRWNIEDVSIRVGLLERFCQPCPVAVRFCIAPEGYVSLPFKNVGVLRRVQGKCLILYSFCSMGIVTVEEDAESVIGYAVYGRELSYALGKALVPL